MRLVITEKQLRGIIKSGEVKEQEASATPPEAPSAPDSSSDGGGDTGGGGTGYPSVTKWESGATRGPANQVAVTKWSDIVGNTIKRGKSNPLN
jgi:hypothetical protein